MLSCKESNIRLECQNSSILSMEQMVMEKLDRDQIDLPTIKFSQQAKEQLSLMLEHDFTLKEKSLRILISGKGCHGFDYQVGFDEIKEDDFITRLDLDNKNIQVIMDPFSAHYLQECIVDYILDLEQNIDGFVVVNLNQKEFAGKFWKEDSSKVPPTL